MTDFPLHRDGGASQEPCKTMMEMKDRFKNLVEVVNGVIIGQVSNAAGPDTSLVDARQLLSLGSSLVDAASRLGVGNRELHQKLGGALSLVCHLC